MPIDTLIKLQKIDALIVSLAIEAVEQPHKAASLLADIARIAIRREELKLQNMIDDESENV